MENLPLRSFKRFFDFKGNVAPIAEKAVRNFTLKKENPDNLKQRLHYFAIGHTFKNIDTKNIFEYTLNEETRESMPTKFLALQQDNFTIDKDLEKLPSNIRNKDLGSLLSDIRNINSHYVHDFEKLKLDNIDDKIIEFLKQSFELALINTILKEKEISYEDFISNESEKEIVDFLVDKFYPLNDQRKDLDELAQKSLDNYIEFRDDFKNKTKDDAINAILFVNVETEYEWKIYGEHHIFNITKGSYLSFEACLFLLSMFLYKGEANTLISKIKGFKRNDDNKYRSKRNLFSFYSKKFSSQDINSEENHLIKFRDIVQYLNHYPTIWNKDLELESNNPLMTDKLKEKIIEMEVARCFPDLNSDIEFNEFAIQYLFYKKESENHNKNLYLDIINKNDEVRKIYYSIKNDSLNLREFKDNTFKMYALKYVVNKYFKDNKKLTNLKHKRFYGKKEREFKDELITNNKTEKLKIQISKNKLFVSYGRNQERFIDFAMCFLAKTNYFGKDAEFKIYQFYSSEEQNEELNTLKQKLTKKQYDKLKYHRGKLVHFSTFENHLGKYDNWDTPFVIENNAVQVRVTFLSGIQKIVSIQRNLLTYFLEDALFNYSTNKLEDAGKRLISGYFTHHLKEFSESKLILEQKTSISQDEKTSLKKILPKRLLHHYSPAIQNFIPKFSTFELLLEKVKIQENRYLELFKKVEGEEMIYKKSNPHDKNVSLVKDFLKRNKGRQFKLNFIRKACHLMYFKESYLKQVEVSGHHKRFHISKDEFNDFSKWMFAFDEVPAYKLYLAELFESKGFFDNPEFKSLFESSTSLSNMYENTKDVYENWLLTLKQSEKDKDKYKLSNYEKFFADDLFYINVSHFLKYLESTCVIARNEQGNIIYKSLENEKHLILGYYYKNKLEKAEYKTCGKLYNKLKSIKLEDALLFELAMYYLKIDKSISQKARTDITTLLSQDVIFEIKDSNSNHLFDIEIPFNKIDAYVELITFKEEQEDDPRFSKTSFIGNLPAYIEKVKDNKDIQQVYYNYNTTKNLTYDDLYTINNHIISNSVKFTKVALLLEKYFIWKDEIKIKNGYNIDFENVIGLKNYFDKEKKKNEIIRNKAFHFGVPDKSYDVIIKEIEQKFIKEEVKPTTPSNYHDLSKQLKWICKAFLDTIHNDYFVNGKGDKSKKRADAENKYFYKVINKT